MILKIVYRPQFLRLYSKLENKLQEEVKEKIELLRNTDNHSKLKVHKLHGYLRGNYSFSINYRFRILFEYNDKNTVALLVIGDHDIYL